MITKAQLIEAIREATTAITVHVPSEDYYRRRGDAQEERISFVDGDRLVQCLEGLEG